MSKKMSKGYEAQDRALGNFKRDIRQAFTHVSATQKAIASGKKSLKKNNGPKLDDLGEVIRFIPLGSPVNRVAKKYKF